MNRYKMHEPRPSIDYPLTIGDKVKFTKEGVAKIRHNLTGMLPTNDLEELRGTIKGVSTGYHEAAFKVVWSNKKMGRKEQEILTKHLERINE